MKIKVREIVAWALLGVVTVSTVVAHLDNKKQDRRIQGIAARANKEKLHRGEWRTKPEKFEARQQKRPKVR